MKRKWRPRTERRQTRSCAEPSRAKITSSLADSEEESSKYKFVLALMDLGRASKPDHDRKDR